MNHNQRIEHEQFADIAKGRWGEPLYLTDSGAPRNHTGANTFVTTWPGTAAMIVTRLSEWTAYAPNGGEYERCHITARDLAGRTWKGYGMGRGMLCRMHMVSS